MQQQQKKAYSGKITEGAKKRLTRAISLLVESAENKKIFNPITGRDMWHRLSFITLTVSDSTRNIDGAEAYDKLLKHFLQWMRRTKKISTYVWKAEYQKRGQIHYHITTPSFIKWNEIKDKWNNLQRSAGLLTDYYARYGHYNPNSTDIHKVNKVDDLAAYLVKYFVKAYQNEKSVGGKVWDCSDNLKSQKYFTIVQRQFHHDFLLECVQQGEATLYQTDRFSIFKFTERPHTHLLDDSEMDHYNNHLNNIRNNTQLTLQTEIIELRSKGGNDQKIIVLAPAKVRQVEINYCTDSFIDQLVKSSTSLE